MSQFTVSDCKIITLPQMSDERGHLAVLENEYLPFTVARLFFIYEVPEGKHRGGHAHKEQITILFALNGSIEITLKDGISEKRVKLTHPTEGLILQPGIWSDLAFENTKTVCLAVNSGTYDEADYIRDYQEFLAIKNKLVF